MMMLQPEEAAILASTSRPPQQPLSLITTDLASSPSTYSHLVREVACCHTGLVCIVGTGLSKEVPRSTSAWPMYSHIRQDGMCGGLVLHYHKSLRVEELPSLVSTTFPGIWVAVRKAPVRGVLEEEVTVVGVVFASGLGRLVEAQLATCVVKVKKKFGSGVNVMVAGNQSSPLQNGSEVALEQGCHRVLVSLFSWPGQLLSLNPCQRPKILARMLFWGILSLTVVILEITAYLIRDCDYWGKQTNA